MPGSTNRGKFLILGRSYVATAVPANYFVALVTDTVPPTADTNTLSQLDQIAVGNGYTDGGIQLTPGATDFPVHTEDDANDRALVQIRDLVWTAAGGSIPSGGAGARWSVLTDNNGTIGNRQVDCFWDLQADRQVSDGQTLTLQQSEIRITE